DPVELARSPLVDLFGAGSQEEAAARLRRTLVDGIEALRPDTTVPEQAKAWRYYYALRHHFVEQFTQREVARDFGISIRQLRRLERDALQLLAGQLWHQHGLEKLVQDEPVAQHPTKGRPPSQIEEVAWSQQIGRASCRARGWGA